MTETNILYYGDNLTILRKYIREDTIDLIYLDPPFNSKATYNILFKEPTGEQSKAQVEAFEDTWHWTIETEKTFQEIVDTAPSNVVELMIALRGAIHENDMMAYLTMMCIRLLELKRVLKDTGSIYLHCDPTASHYLKTIMDAIFGFENFRNEIIYCFSGGGIPKKNFPRKHQIILRYTKNAEEYSERGIFNIEYRQYGEWTEKHKPRHSLTSGGKELDMGRGTPINDWWSDLKHLTSYQREWLGYPTQKPEALLERIVRISSNEGEVILDPFCGCGTALVAAERLKRKWIGIDITHLAISLMKWRLKNNFPDIEFKVIGEPMDLSGAKELANQNRYQFQWWALSQIDARPYGDKKKGADTGIDGYYYFNDGGATKKAIVSVKSGDVTVSQVRDLNAVVERERASMGFFITLENPTVPMKEEAVKKGFYTDSHHNKYPKVQILTIEEILNGKEPETPQKVPIYKSNIKREEKEKGEQKKLLEGET